MDFALQIPWETVVEVGRTGAATLFTGFAVKLMDDLVDEPLTDELADELSIRKGAGGEPEPVVDPLGGPRGRAVYALTSLAVGAALFPSWAVALFLAAYAVGMIGQHGRLPTGVPPWAEGVSAVAVAAIFAGWVETAAAVGAMVAVQAVDDLIDRREDLKWGERNWTRRLGVAGTALLALTGLVQTAIFIPRMAVWVALCVPLVERGVRKWSPIQGRQRLDTSNRGSTPDRIFLTPSGVCGGAPARQGRGLRPRSELRPAGDAPVQFGAGEVRHLRRPCEGGGAPAGPLRIGRRARTRTVGYGSRIGGGRFGRRDGEQGNV